MSSSQSTPQVRKKGEKASRIRRITTSDVDRVRIVTAYENGATPTSISQILNIPISTVYGIIKMYKKTWQVAAKKRGGNRPKALSPEAIESLRRWIAEDSTITLKSLTEKVHLEHGVRVSLTTIAREVKEFKTSTAHGTSSAKSSADSTRLSKK
ncbi:uncharacterized protein LOC128711051 [Anopheles marshallii]|uniref:uncharacterized protein LOC128711051 n=1 Tax=Anopheles marshallii TaxID=1521116 RepID=UPI00237B8F40|nr:uncharacterized protein LOC128711051 [Anopheles marshallii]